MTNSTPNKWEKMRNLCFIKYTTSALVHIALTQVPKEKKIRIKGNINKGFLKWSRWKISAYDWSKEKNSSEKKFKLLCWLTSGKWKIRLAAKGSETIRDLGRNLQIMKKETPCYDCNSKYRVSKGPTEASSILV